MDHMTDAQSTPETSFDDTSQSQKQRHQLISFVKDTMQSFKTRVCQ